MPAWTEFLADVIEKGTFKMKELETKSRLGFAGAREALDVLVYEHKVPYRYAHRVCGELVRLGTDGSREADIVATVAERLADFPAIDCEKLVKIATGESSDAILLNVPAFKAVHAEVSDSLARVERENRPNAVEVAIAKLIAEGETLANG